jgi:hypothetical protein
LLTASPRDMQNAGNACTKFVVPSILAVNLDKCKEFHQAVLKEESNPRVNDEGGFFSELLARIVGFFADEFEIRMCGEEAS